MVLDELKLSSDDAQFTEDHVMFLLNKYRTFLDFNNNSNSVNMTPVVHKEEVDYQNLNYNNQIPVKNHINNPFVFSSSPNHVQLEFGSVSMSGNNQKNIANFAGNNNSSGFYITNNNTTNNERREQIE